MKKISLTGVLSNYNYPRILGNKNHLYATGPRLNTSKPHKGASHVIHTYLLRVLKVTSPYQVWAMDISYFPLAGSHLYLVAIIDVYSRYIVAGHCPTR